MLVASSVLLACWPAQRPALCILRSVPPSGNQPHCVAGLNRFRCAGSHACLGRRQAPSLPCLSRSRLLTCFVRSPVNATGLVASAWAPLSLPCCIAPVLLHAERAPRPPPPKNKKKNQAAAATGPGRSAAVGGALPRRWRRSRMRRCTKWGARRRRRRGTGALRASCLLCATRGR